MINLPDGESVLLGDLELSSRIGNHILSQHLIAPAEVLNGNCRHDADEGSHELGVDEVLLLSKWLHDDIVEVLHVVVAPGSEKEYSFWVFWVSCVLVSL